MKIELRMEKISAKKSRKGNFQIKISGKFREKFRNIENNIWEIIFALKWAWFNQTIKFHRKYFCLRKIRIFEFPTLEFSNQKFRQKMLIFWRGKNWLQSQRNIWRIVTRILIGRWKWSLRGPNRRTTRYRADIYFHT